MCIRQTAARLAATHPGIGFGKTTAHNLELLANLDVLVAKGFPVVVGTSRKGFVGRLLAEADGRSDESATALTAKGVWWRAGEPYSHQ